MVARQQTLAMDADAGRDVVTDESTIERAPFGHLRYGTQYGAEYWLGSIVLSGFPEAFAMIVRAGREGPSPAQAAALQKLVSDIHDIRRQATGPMAELHREGGLAFPTGEREEGVWAVLRPEEIEVSSESYYQDGRIFAALIFGSALDPDFAPAIETADGVFQQVLFGT